MELEDTPENRIIRQVVATMAIENMYLPKSFVLELQKVLKGIKTTDQLIKEIHEDLNRQ